MITLFDDFISGSGNLIIHSPIDYEELEQKRLTFDLVVKVMISYVKTKLKSGLYTLGTWRQPTLLWKKGPKINFVLIHWQKNAKST